MRTPSVTLDMLYNYFRDNQNREITTAELLAVYTAGWDLPPRALADVKGRINSKCCKLASQHYIIKLDFNLWIFANKDLVNCENFTNLD